ncbi:hypothetical protein I4U23_023438 [Adineta vaga]|nr:hypothetical protein I4U23_023438 [Adineta vaga]
MSNITLATDRSLVDTITRVSEILLIFDSYMIVMLYITGVVGAILNIITFLQKQIRRNPCSLYFLSTSVVDLGIMQVFLLMEIITRFNPIFSTLIYSTRVWCKLGNYMTFVFPCLTSCYLTLASFDRFCMSSLNQTLRKWSRLIISRIVVIIMLMIWALFGLHVPIAYDYVQDSITNTSRCTVQTSLAAVFIAIDGYFFSLFNGVIIPFLLLMFGIMIIHNVKKSRRRVTTQVESGNNSLLHGTGGISNRQNSHMIKMLLVQVSLRIIFHLPYTVIYLLSFYRRLSSDLESLLLYIIFSYIARWLYYGNFCKKFYVNTLTSALFRDSLRLQCVNFLLQHRISIILRTFFSTHTNNR